MMGPAFLIKMLQEKLNVTENCTGRNFPTLGFTMMSNDGKEHTLTMDAEDYMDREMSEGTDYCWAHLLPIGDTGRGPIFVLGMPFLRKFYTAYNMEQKKIGIALAQQDKPLAGKPAPPAEAVVPLIAIRPGGDDIGGKTEELSNRPKKIAAHNVSSKIAAHNASSKNASKKTQ